MTMPDNIPTMGPENSHRRYNGISEMATGKLDGEADFEIRLISGLEGRELSLAQARALLALLEWAAARPCEQAHGRRRAA